MLGFLIQISKFAMQISKTNIYYIIKQLFLKLLTIVFSVEHLIKAKINNALLAKLLFSFVIKT